MTKNLSDCKHKIVGLELIETIELSNGDVYEHYWCDKCDDILVHPKYLMRRKSNG